jgi:hypothetical protein
MRLKLLAASLCVVVSACTTEGENLTENHNGDGGGREEDLRAPLDGAGEDGAGGPIEKVEPYFKGVKGWRVLSCPASDAWQDMDGVTLSGDAYRFYVAGFGRFVQFNGTQWDEHDIGQGALISSIWVESAGFMVIAGDLGLLQQITLKENSGKPDVTIDSTGLVDQDLTAVHGFDKEHVWAVGKEGAIVELVGGVWTPHKPEELGFTKDNAPDFSAVVVISPDEALIAGDSLVVHYKGGTATVDSTTFAKSGTLPAAYELGGLEVAGSTVWLAASMGRIFKWNPTGAWEPHQANPYSHFEEFWLSPSGKLYAVGSDPDPVVWAYTEGAADLSWENSPVETPDVVSEKRIEKDLSPDRVPPTSRISGIWGTGDDNYFVCTREKQIIHYAVH